MASYVTVEDTSQQLASSRNLIWCRTVATLDLYKETILYNVSSATL